MWTHIVDPCGLEKVLKIQHFFNFLAAGCWFLIPCPLESILLWVSVWVSRLTDVFENIILMLKVRKATIFYVKMVAFLVAEAGLEPTFSGL